MGGAYPPQGTWGRSLSRKGRSVRPMFSSANPNNEPQQLLQLPKQTRILAYAFLQTKIRRRSSSAA